MPTFDPAKIITDHKGKSWPTGEIADPAKEEEYLELRTTYLNAKTDAERAEINERCAIFMRQHQGVLTVGRAIVEALGAPLEDDKGLSYQTKLDHDTWALEIIAAEKAGETVTVDNSRVETYKIRVNKRWSVARIVAEVMRAIVPDVAPAVKKPNA